jgi:hypothetical protein
MFKCRCRTCFSKELDDAWKYHMYGVRNKEVDDVSQKLVLSNMSKVKYYVKFNQKNDEILPDDKKLLRSVFTLKAQDNYLRIRSICFQYMHKCMPYDNSDEIEFDIIVHKEGIIGIVRDIWIPPHTVFTVSELCHIREKRFYPVKFHPLICILQDTDPNFKFYLRNRQRTSFKGKSFYVHTHKQRRIGSMIQFFPKSN